MKFTLVAAVILAAQNVFCAPTTPYNNNYVELINQYHLNGKLTPETVVQFEGLIPKVLDILFKRSESLDIGHNDLLYKRDGLVQKLLHLLLGGGDDE
ncbi:hypothetical protein H4219_002925 [Mycoemilia scoparia]|uniref:Uncharacterized protein n=1 Tax=Mycoemilia scoparia TaxID=417184 RepID=A0A9W8DNI6_9FUNG|nr:hypothetical protein H4219_002925 [Mycoemilia scoparia]